MKQKIDIDTKTFVRFLLVVSIFVGFVFILWKLSLLLLILAVSFFLAIALNKPVSALSRRLPGHSRVLATALSYILLVGVLGVFVVVVVPPIISQTSSFISGLPGYIQQIGSQGGVIGDLINEYQLQDEVNSFIQGVQGQAGNLAQGVGSNVVAGVSTVLSGFITVIMILVLTFLMLIEGPMWLSRLWDTYTNKAQMKRHQNLLQRMYRVVTGFINGQVLVASIAGLAATLTLFILASFFAVPMSMVLPLGVIMLGFGLIPLIGPITGAAVVLLVLLLSDVSAAIIFLLYFVIYQQIETNVIQPTVQSRSVELSALTVLASAIAGVMLLGVIGGILAIPIAGCLRVLIHDYFEHRKSNKPLDAKLAKESA